MRPPLFPRSAPPMTAPRPVMALGAVAAVGWFTLFQLAAFMIAGRFDYPFDDVYIHLSMAAGIAEGYYGLNNGEAASAASSILYPLLLLPFPGTEFQRLLPLFWNILGVLASGALIGGACAYLSHNAARVVAAFLPGTLNLAGLGFGGMEHTLHLVTALLCVFGLWLWLSDRRLAWWFVAALVLGPLLRYEALALSLLSLIAMALSGARPARLAGLGAAILAPVLSFSLFLTSLGLPPLPNSVRVKQVEAQMAHSGMAGIWENIRGNFDYLSGPLFFALAILGLILALRARAARAPALVLGTVSAALLAHMLIGRTGWMHRYETYAVIAFAAGVMIAWDRARKTARLPLPGVAVLGLMMALHGVFTLTLYKVKYVYGPRSIHAQQGQMARLAKEHLKAPVGVNDLGYVVWNNPHLVIDLWGLANREALDLRRAGEANWASALMTREGVRHAMFYDSWLQKHMSPDWITVGWLSYTGRFGTIGDNPVAFYAADEAAAEQMRSAIKGWLPGLPATAAFTFAEEGRS